MTKDAKSYSPVLEKKKLKSTHFIQSAIIVSKNQENSHENTDYMDYNTYK